MCLLCQHNTSLAYDLIPEMMLQRKNIKVIIECIYLGIYEKDYITKEHGLHMVSVND